MLSPNEQMLIFNKEKGLSNAQREFDEMTKQLNAINELLSIQREKHALEQRNIVIATDEKVFKLITPNWEFEKTPEYLENIRKVNLLNGKLKDLEFQRAMFQYESNARNLAEQIESQTVMIKKYTAEIAELKSKGE